MSSQVFVILPELDESELDESDDIGLGLTVRQTFFLVFQLRMAIGAHDVETEGRGGAWAQSRSRPCAADGVIHSYVKESYLV